jgi:DNA-binding IclR family transcriptional regulator
MPRPVPAATATLRVLRFLSGQPVPVPATRIAEALGLPRSTAYHLLTAMVEEDFVVHYPDDRTWGIGIAAWEVGHGFARQEPLARLARIPLARLVDRVGQSAHLVVLHGTDVLYVIEERAPGRPPLVTDVGVRLPAHLTASGRAILASLPAQQVRALHPDRASFTSRTGKGPSTPTELRRLLAATRQRGYATEDGEVTTGFASIAAPILAGAIHASVAVTWETREEVGDLVEPVRATATEITRRLRRA